MEDPLLCGVSYGLASSYDGKISRFWQPDCQSASVAGFHPAHLALVLLAILALALVLFSLVIRGGWRQILSFHRS